MSEPRGIEDRLTWFLSHNPSGPGMCAQHSWHSLGGNQNPPNPPAWGTSNANAVYDKVKASGRYWTGTPERGALVLWKYGDNGHAAICYDAAGTKIATTDPTNKPGGVGVEPISYPSKWGASSNARIWTDEYNGVRFPVGGGISEGEVYLSKLVYGQEDSDSVARLQAALNAHPLDGGEELPITGNYFDQTDEEVRLCQRQHGYGNDAPGESNVGPEQAEHLFEGTGNTIINDLPAEPDPPDPPDPEEPEPPSSGGDGYAWDVYSGKPSGTLTVNADDGYVRLDADTSNPPGDGLEIHMAYWNCDLSWSGSKPGTIRVKYVRDDGDATGYADYHVNNGASDFLITSMHWEAGEAGKGGRWWINVGGGITKAVVSTRYQKAGGVTYDTDGSKTAARVMQATFGLSPRAVRVAAVVVAALAAAGTVLGVAT